MNLGTLNTIIALVIVLLVLSLLVQAIQMFLKKLLKLKSKQIEDSLKDLYKQAIANEDSTALGEPGQPNTTSPPDTGPPSTPVGGEGPAVKTPADLFTEKVLNQFKNLGRVTRFGNPILDSLSKEDLIKVMSKLESQDFFPDYAAKFQLLCNQVNELRSAIETLSNNQSLRGTVNTRLAEMRSILAPAFNDVAALLDGQKIKDKVVFGDLLRLRQLSVSEVLSLLQDAQQAVTQEIRLASKSSPPGPVNDLTLAANELARIARMIGELSQKFDDAIAPLRKKLEQVEIWFDTVTQSFDERYARNMRTVSIYISIVVVILLNANFFRVYRSLSTNEVQRNLIVQNGPAVLQLARTPDTEPGSSATPTPPDQPPPSPSPTPVNIKEEAERTRQNIKVLLSTYEDFGFAPLNGAQVWSLLWSLGGWTGLAKDDHGQRGWTGFTTVTDAKGVPLNSDGEPMPANCQAVDKEDKPVNCRPKWRLQSAGEWWESLKGDVVGLIGWFIMVLLLSVGAPFWQDALESLFGIKTLLRQKSGTRNVEDKSGAGQPKQA